MSMGLDPKENCEYGYKCMDFSEQTLHKPKMPKDQRNVLMVRESCGTFTLGKCAWDPLLMNRPQNNN